jgi:hypothetical protein
VSRQVPVPRWSGILVEPRVPRTLGKLGLALDDVLSEGRDLEQRLAREALPAAFEEAVARLRASLAAGFDGVVEATAAVDPTLRKPALAASARWSASSTPCGRRAGRRSASWGCPAIWPGTARPSPTIWPRTSPRGTRAPL